VVNLNRALFIARTVDSDHELAKYGSVSSTPRSIDNANTGANLSLKKGMTAQQQAGLGCGVDMSKDGCKDRASA
jgi:hypothetical protein